jgi:hypothetical protein
MIPVSGSTIAQSYPGSPGTTNYTSSPANMQAADLVWLERVERCKKRLPDPEMLSLFESAEEMDQCAIVYELFQAYGEPNAGTPEQ